MKKLLSLMFATALVLTAPVALAKEEKEDKKKANREEKRAAIDKVAQEALDEILEKAEKAKDLYANAHGWAVVLIKGVGVGDDGVQVVVPPAQLQYHEDWVFLHAGH